MRCQERQCQCHFLHLITSYGYCFWWAWWWHALLRSFLCMRSVCVCVLFSRITELGEMPLIMFTCFCFLPRRLNFSATAEGSVHCFSHSFSRDPDNECLTYFRFFTISQYESWNCLIIITFAYRFTVEISFTLQRNSAPSPRPEMLCARVSKFLFQADKMFA